MKDSDIQKFAIGLGAMFLLVKISKNYFKMPRPIMWKDSTFGMPSTRATTIFFIVVFLILCNKISTTTILMLVTMALIACSIKYIMKEHSLNQLFVGAILGTVVAWLLYRV